MALYQNVTVPVPKTATNDHFRRLPPFLANDKNEGRNRVCHFQDLTPAAPIAD